MGIVPLSSPLTVGTQTFQSINVRIPGRSVFQSMLIERLSGGFTDAAVIRFAARLSDRREITLRKLSETDVAVVRREVETLYTHGLRRFRGDVPAGHPSRAGLR